MTKRVLSASQSPARKRRSSTPSSALLSSGHRSLNSDSDSQSQQPDLTISANDSNSSSATSKSPAGAGTAMMAWKIDNSSSEEEKNVPSHETKAPASVQCVVVVAQAAARVHVDNDMLSVKTGASQNTTSSALQVCQFPFTPSPPTNSPSPTPAPSATSANPFLTLVPYNSPDAFPLFRTGDVIIHNPLHPTIQIFHLHSSILARHSSWFVDSFKQNFPDIPTPAWYCYNIEDVDGSITLVRKPAHGKCPIIYDLNRRSATPSSTISTLSTPSTTATPPPTRPATGPLALYPSQVPDHYAQILSLFYTPSPSISISTTTLPKTLTHAEALCSLARELSCLPLLRPQISNALSSHRKPLYLAIRHDPARWIQLAIALEDISIYSESMVHLVGAWPAQPWPTKLNISLNEADNGDDLTAIIKEKAEDLERKCKAVDRKLLLITLTVGPHNTPIPVSPNNKADTEPWILVSVFRDYIASRLRFIQDHKFSTLVRGRFYRQLKRQSGYLEYEDVLETCNTFYRGEWNDLSADLKDLKEYAARIVEGAGLGVNECMVDADECGVGWLTCVKVDLERDVVWRRKEGNSRGRDG